jgi:CRAL/TRIO domain
VFTEHYIYVNEYLWQILERQDAMATMTSILDLQGLNFKYLRNSEIVNFMKVFVQTMDQHYPQRTSRVVVYPTREYVT